MIEKIDILENEIPTIQTVKINAILDQRESDKKNRDIDITNLENEITRLKQDRDTLYSRIFKLEKKNDD